MTYEEFLLNEMGYQCKTTFWQDFSIADKFGANAVRDTFNRAFEEWKGNAVYLTELVLILNHKIWYHHEATKNWRACMMNYGARRTITPSII